MTPKGGDTERYRGRVPRVVASLVLGCLALLGYAGLGLAGLVPWHTDLPSTVSSGLWLLLATGVLGHAVRRIRDEQYATSRRAAHRFPVGMPVTVDGVSAELVDVSVNGAAVRLGAGRPVGAEVTLELPGAEPIVMRHTGTAGTGDQAVTKLNLPAGNWHSLRSLALWLFHTPSGVVDGLPDGLPVVALRQG